MEERERERELIQSFMKIREVFLMLISFTGENNLPALAASSSSLLRRLRRSLHFEDQEEEAVCGAHLDLFILAMKMRKGRRRSAAQVTRHSLNWQGKKERRRFGKRG